MEEAQKEQEIDYTGSLYARHRDISNKTHRNRFEKDVFCARERAVAVADYQTRRIREMKGEIVKAPGGRGTLHLERHLGIGSPYPLNALALAHGGGKPLGTILKNGRRARNTESAEDSFARLSSRDGLDLYHHTIDRERGD